MTCKITEASSSESI